MKIWKKIRVLKTFTGAAASSGVTGANYVYGRIVRQHKGEANPELWCLWCSHYTGVTLEATWVSLEQRNFKSSRSLISTHRYTFVW